jgi:hypothetical protein
MNSKVMRNVIGCLFVSLALPGCTKKKTVTVQDSTLSYYLPKINGSRNWVGVFYDYVGKRTADTTIRIVLKTISDSIVVAYVNNRAETLYYFETNEIEKVFHFSGGSDNIGQYYFSDYLTYNYANDQLFYDEYYNQRPYGMYINTISSMKLHAP